MSLTNFQYLNIFYHFFQRFNYLNKFIKRRFFLSTSTSSLLLIACVIVVFCAKCSVVTKRSFSFGIIKEG
ncbi:hypothetical protein RIR_jg10980.t1 [Rhizophagus irregularis DAOM 181602=DAOM 197198]|nr:hypothetical protein RIR_jg10980.t1 [Rhizophagus irregularis DAOM 181602=DAOM 197198]